MDADFRLALQRGEWCIFAAVRVRAERLPQRQFSLEIPAKVLPEWELGIRYGFGLLRECVSRAGETSSGVAVEILEFSGQPVDTTISAAAYVTFQAICRALSLRVSEAFRFDRTTGCFCFDGVGPILLAQDC